jgi:hypothetical protein
MKPDLAELRALLERATPGPWEKGPDAGLWAGGEPLADLDIYDPAPFSPQQCHANADLIVWLRNNAASLLALAEAGMGG